MSEYLSKEEIKTMEKLIRKNYIRGVCCQIGEKVEEKNQQMILLILFYTDNLLFLTNLIGLHLKLNDSANIADRAFEKKKKFMCLHFLQKS